MPNSKGFVTLEAVFYIIIMLIMSILLATIIKRNVTYQNNSKIKMYQGIDMLKESLVKYPKITNFNNDEVEFINEIKIIIKDNQIYETPGYMPYLQGIENASFQIINKKLFLLFKFKNNYFKAIIFHVK